MDAVQEMLRCLLTEPTMSNEQIGRRVGRDRRVVARYRRLTRGFDWAELKDFDGRTLRRIFNVRRPRRIHALPPFALLGRSGGSVHAQWAGYTQNGYRPGSLSYGHFRRLRQAWLANGGVVDLTGQEVGR